MIRPDSEAVKLLWDNLRMFDEHTWTADRAWDDPEHAESIRQAAVKESRATNGKLLTGAVAGPRHGLDFRLHQSAQPDAGAVQSLELAADALSWRRTSIEGIKLVDLSTKETVPYQELYSGKGFRHVRFLAQNVPSLGYKTSALEPEPAEPPGTCAERLGDT